MAFHPYPRLIRRLFNAYRFGPPSTVTPTSAWTRVDHRVSRSAPPTKPPYSGSLSLRLTRLRRLTSPATLTRRLIMQKARRHPIKGLRPLVGARVQDLFHSPRGVLFTFPSRYYALSVFREYLALRDGPRRFRPDFSCPAVLRDRGALAARAGTGMSPSSSAAFQPRSRPRRLGTCPGPTTPRRPRPPRFGLLPFRSPLLGESMFLSPPAGTGMFRFPAFARLSAYAHSLRVGCPIRTPPDHFALADPRGVSPLAASFIASGSQGIHRAPFSVSLRSPARASPPARDPGGDISPRGDSFNLLS